ncbi:MAG: hypothetical protein AAGE94_02430 [Acidobacteriota bacterium]
MLFGEVWEEAGEFGGVGSAFETAQMPLDLTALQDQAAEQLATDLDGPTRAALLAFAASVAGDEYAWLSRELASHDGQNDLVRHGRTVHERLPPERIAALEAIDRAIGARQLALSIVDQMVGLVDGASAQIAGLTGEPAEWDNPAAQVSARLGELAARRAFIQLSYRTSRLDAGELSRLLDWVESSEGQAFQAARQSVLLGAVAEVAEAFAQAQQAAIDVELAELRRERENEDEGDDEDDGDEPGRGDRRR